MIRKEVKRKRIWGGGEKEGKDGILGIDKGIKARIDTSGRKTGGIIALIDQPDNSISICVIQMVFNFPQRYLHSSIYISSVRKCLALRSSLSTGLLLGLALLSFLFFFLESFKNCGLSYLHVVNFSKLFPSRPIEISSNVPILNVCIIGLFV